MIEGHYKTIFIELSVTIQLSNHVFSTATMNNLELGWTTSQEHAIVIIRTLFYA